MLKFSIHIFKAKYIQQYIHHFKLNLNILSKINVNMRGKSQFSRILGMALIFHGMVFDKNNTIFDLSVTNDFQLVENYDV